MTKDHSFELLNGYDADTKLVSRINRLVIAYGVSLLTLAIAIAFSYVILNKVLSTQRTLTEINSHVNEILLSVTDSVGVLSDYRVDLKKQESDSRLGQLITKRAQASTAELAQKQAQLLETQDAISKTSAWSELQWIISDDDSSPNSMLTSYIRQMKLLTAESTDQSHQPQIPVEAAGSRTGSLYLGLKEASNQLQEAIVKNADRVKSIHKAQTASVFGVMILVSLLVVAPLWLKLKSEHRRLNEAHKHLYKMAYTDRETGLLNLDGLERNLEKLIPPGNGEDDYYLLLVRITNLDEIHNLLESHNTDELILLLTDRVKTCSEFQWCRSGEAEYTSLIPLEKVDDSISWPHEIIEKLSDKLRVAGLVVTPRISMAVSRISKSETKNSGVLWLHQSNARLASATFDRKSCCLPQYHPQLKNALADHNSLINQISEGITQQQFVPFYQVKVDAYTGQPNSIEVLARWRQNENTLVSPYGFIEAAESSGLIVGLTYSLFDQVLDDIQGWCSQGLSVGRVAINLAADVLHNDELLERLTDMAGKVPSLCAGLEVEITENIALDENIEQTIAKLKHIRSLGIHVAIDDFGTGYASLQTLIDIPFDVLKIDRSFVLPMTETGGGTEVISAMISLSNKLEKVCVVEGVETAWQWHRLTELGADELQGFYFHKPCDADAIPQALYKRDGFRLAG